MLRQLALALCILLTPPLASAQTTKFRIEEATIEDIQAAILRGELTSTRVVQLYLNRIKAYNGTCVNQPDGVLGLGPITPIKNAHQLNALITLNLRLSKREELAFDRRKARSMTDPVDNDPAMPDALEVAAQQDAYFASTGKLIGPLHGAVFAIKDQYDTFDMRTTAGMDADYANDRPPRDATFVKRLREAGAIILAKANLGEMGTPNSRSSFGGPFCNPYDTERSPGTSSGGSGASVSANLVTCAIGEETGGSIHHPAKNNSLVGLAPTQELVSRAGMLGAALNTRVGPLCRTVKDAARVLEVIAGYDPRDELTAFSVGRLPSEPYRNFANERALNGIRIGVIREHMDKKAFNEADAESIDIADRAISDLRRVGATIVDPGPGGALFQGCIDKYVPLYRNRAFMEQVPNLFPADFNGKPASDRISVLVDMFFDPSLVPAGSTIRNIAPATNPGLSKYMLNRYLRERGDSKIKSLGDLIEQSNFYKDIRPDAGFVDRKAALEELNSNLMLDTADVFRDRLAYQQVVLQCMAQENLDALVSPAGNIPAYILGAPMEPPLAGRTNSVWGLLGQHGIPTLSVPAGFTTHVFDRIRDSAARDGTRLVGPVPAKLPVGIMFFGRPFSEPTLLRIASAYEAATKHRIPPPDFGPLPEPL
ncbi:MAG TPA: amidase family protein [Bryobacteraceae bacterium]|nr:amidase family protein [Bryobacteraceae bacterium]